MPYPTIEDLQHEVDSVLASDDPRRALSGVYRIAHDVAIENGARFRALIQNLPTELWHGDPAIAAALGFSFRASDTPRGPVALAYFDVAQAAVDADPDNVPAWCKAAVLLGHAAAYRTQGRMTSATAKLDAVDALLATDLASADFVPLRARAALERGIFFLHTGDLDAARIATEYAHGLAPHYLTRAEHIEALGVLAVIEYSHGQLDSALRHTAWARAIEAPPEVFASSYAAPVLLAESLVLLERYDVAAALPLEPAMEEASSRTEWEPFSATVVGLRLALERRGAEALEQLRVARQGYRHWEERGLGYDIGELLRGSILMRADQGEKAYEVLSAVDQRGHHVVCAARYIAKLRLDHGDLLGANAALAECDALGDDHSPRTLIDVWMLHAAIDHERGLLPSSDLLFDRAMLRITETGTRQPLAMVESGLLSRLAERATQRRVPPAVRELLDGILATTPAVPDTTSTALSARERLILSTVVRELTVAQIASELFISPNTVKTHLRRLYRKLGVSTRDEAIRKARALGLHSETAE